jgi:hypothetical protein
LSDFRDLSGINLIVFCIIIHIFKRPHSDNNRLIYSWNKIHEINASNFGYLNTSQSITFITLAVSVWQRHASQKSKATPSYSCIQFCKDATTHSNILIWLIKNIPLFGLQYLLYPRIIITLDLNVGLLQFQHQIVSTDIRTFLCNVQTLPSGITSTRFWHCNSKQQHNDPLRYWFLHNSCQKHRIDMILTREDVALYELSIACVQCPLQTFISGVVSILTTHHQATTCLVIVLSITSAKIVGLNSFLTALVCVWQLLTLNRFEHLERTCIHRVTIIITKLHHGGVTFVQHRTFGPVIELGLSANWFH